MGMYETLKNPAMIAMIGPTPVKLVIDYTLGAMYSHLMLLYCALFAMIVSALHVVGYTRKEEDLGLTEHIRSFPVGRQANSFAVFIEIIIINVILALFIGALLIGFRQETIDFQGSILFGASIGIAGIIGAVIALVMAQIMPTSAGATGSSIGIIGILYIFRAGTDISNAKFSMINPMGWTYLTFPFTKNNWIPLIIAVIFCLIILIVAFSLEGARDMGSSYIPEREGRATAKHSLLSVPGLFIKLNKSVIVGWLVGFAIIGAAYGSIYGDMHTFLSTNEMMKQMFTQSGFTIEESFTAFIMIVLIGLVTILPIVIVNKLFSEEQKMNLSQILATKVTRAQFYWVNIVLAIITGIIGIFLASGALGATAIAVMENNSKMKIGDFLAAGFNLWPSVMFFIGLATLALGWKPKVGKIVYAYLGYSFALNYFEKILDFPKWFSKTAIQSWISQMPIDRFNVITFIIISVISVILIVLGYFGYNKRDMLDGA